MPVFRQHQSRRVAGKFQNRTTLLDTFESGRALDKCLEHFYRQQKRVLSHIYLPADQRLASLFVTFKARGPIFFFFYLTKLAVHYGVIGNISHMITRARLLILNINEVN